MMMMIIIIIIHPVGVRREALLWKEVKQARKIIAGLSLPNQNIIIINKILQNFIRNEKSTMKFN